MFCVVLQVLERDLQDFNQAQLVEQGAIHNSAIDIPMRKDKEDLTESSEVKHTHTHTHSSMASLVVLGVNCRQVNRASMLCG